MATDLDILNLALGKLSPNRVVEINPPRTPLEGFMSRGYPVWKRTVLTKRRWVFATEDNYQLTAEAVLTPEPRDYRKYKFALPNDCLRPIREKTTEWKQRGKYLYSVDNKLTLSYIRDAAEAEFDPLFTDALATFIAQESAMFVTESNTKRKEQQLAHKEAMDEAARNNAYVIGPEDIQEDDSDFSFIMSRYN